MTGPLWTAVEAAAATGGQARGDWAGRGVSIDSRTVARDDLFVALQGPNFDGHEFVGAAIQAGAAAAVVSRRPAGLAADAPLLEIADTMDALRGLGRAARERSSACVIAVTGSVGKTGTKDALRTVLEAQGPTTASAGSLNNQWGVPLSLARMPREAAFGVFEAGMNHAGEIAPLSRMIRPHIAVITAVEPAHIEFFDSVEAIADAKAEIFLGMSGGSAVLNRDNALFHRLAAAATKAGVDRVLGFGAHAKADARLVSCAADATGSNVEAVIRGRRIGYRLSVPGRHQVMNSLAVLAAVSIAGADLAAAARKLGELAPLAGRGRRHTVAVAGGSFTVIDESYNANPASMRAAIETLAAMRPDGCGRRIAVLGEMRELGGRSAEFHLALADILQSNGIDRVFACGPAMAGMIEALPKPMRAGHAADSGALALQVRAAARAGDVVVVKGSLAGGMKTVVETLLAAGRVPSRAANG